jgi:hypothetical protein
MSAARRFPRAGRIGCRSRSNRCADIHQYRGPHHQQLLAHTLGHSVTNIARITFQSCTHLTSITVPASVTSIGDAAFYSCASLTGAYFQGNAPSLGGTDVFSSDIDATIYYHASSLGWSATFGGRPTALW